MIKQQNTMAYLHGYILVLFIFAMPVYGSSMAGISDVDSGNTESDIDANDYHTQLYEYQEYYTRLQFDGVYAFNKIFMAEHPDWSRPGIKYRVRPSVVFGPVMVTHETNSSIVVNSWSGALEKLMKINKAAPPLLVTWLYNREVIQDLVVQDTMESDLIRSRDVLLLNGRSQVISTPKLESCKRYDISFAPTGKQKTRITQFSRSPCADGKQHVFTLHKHCPKLQQLQHLWLDKIYMFTLTINDLARFPKLLQISLFSVPLAFHGMENKLLCSMDNLSDFTYQDSFQNLKQFPSQIFNCSLPLRIHGITFADHAIGLLPAHAFKSAAQNLIYFRLLRAGLKYIDKDAFSGMIHIQSIFIQGNHLIEMPAPYVLPSSKSLSVVTLIDNQSNGVFNLSLITEPYCQPLEMFICNTNNITLLTGQSFCCNNSTLEILVLQNMGTLGELDENMFSKCTALKYISLHTNVLTYFALPSLNELAYLDLSENALNDSNPWSFLLQHPKLHYLNISNNRLTAWNLSLNKLQELTELDLSHNQITYIMSDAFQNLTQLEYIDLGYNKLSIVVPNLFSGLTQLTGIILRKNELLNIANLLAPMTNRNFSILDISHNNLHHCTFQQEIPVWVRVHHKSSLQIPTNLMTSRLHVACTCCMM